MITLACAVAIVGALCVLDLLLTFGVVRRLREHTALLGRMQPSAGLGIGLSAGETPEPFTVTNTEAVTMQGPAGLGVVAFFSTTCPLCPKRVPAFIDYVRAHPVTRDEVLVVIAGESAESVPYLADLAEVARVSFEPSRGPVSQGFAVKGVPAFFVLNAAGAILASGHDAAALPVPARA